MADAVVSIVNTDVYGKCKAYPVENIGASSFARWARETLNLLRAHPQLAKTKRIPLDSVVPEAMEALWGCVAELAAVEKDCEECNHRCKTQGEDGIQREVAEVCHCSLLSKHQHNDS